MPMMTADVQIAAAAEKAAKAAEEEAERQRLVADEKKRKEKEKAATDDEWVKKSRSLFPTDDKHRHGSMSLVAIQ